MIYYFTEMFLIFYVILAHQQVISLLVKTTMTSRYSLKLIDNGHMHPWIYDRDEFKNVDDKSDQAFVDWENSRVR